MKQLDPAFLREVQRRGWQIEAATADGCVGRCPTPGCGLRTHLRETTSIPARVASRFTTAVHLTSMQQMVDIAKDRREQLRLTIAETEHCAGFTPDHLAKAETGRPVNLDTAITWLATLGYRILLEHDELPPITLRMVAETRGKEDSRARRFAREARERTDGRR